jgi:hypothetical protein
VPFLKTYILFEKFIFLTHNKVYQLMPINIINEQAMAANKKL